MTGRISTLAAILGLALCGCQRSHAPTTPTGVPSTDVPTTNSAPVVRLTTDGPPSCNPAGRPCQVRVRAVASDPDRDPLTYTWSGTTSYSTGGGFCSGGQFPTEVAICTISSPEQVVTSHVTVRDTQGHEATASLDVSGEGVNHPPTVHLGPAFELPGGSVTLEMFGSIADPDEPEICTNDHVAGGSAAGDCRPSIAFWSSCLEGGPTVDIYRTAKSGTCEVTLKVRDSAGLVGTTVTTVRY